MSNRPRLSAQEAGLKTKLALTDEEKLILVAKVSADAIYDWDMVAGLTTWNHGLYTRFRYEGDSVQTHVSWAERNRAQQRNKKTTSVVGQVCRLVHHRVHRRCDRVRQSQAGSVEMARKMNGLQMD